MSTQQSIIDFLNQNKDDKYKQFHSKLIKDISPDILIGVRVPILKQKAKEITKENPIEFLETSDNNYYEEKMLKVLVISYMKTDFETHIKYLNDFLPYINCWSICDACMNMKFIKKDRDKMWTYIQPLVTSNQEFTVRFAIVIMLAFFADDEYFDKIIECINKITHTGYYVEMAVAWCISVLYVKMPQKTMQYLKNNTLNKFTYNKALQKIIESYRVSNKDKEIIRNMKRKEKE